MSQILPATFTFGAGKTGLVIGYRVLNPDRTTYSAFSTTDVSESTIAGTYYKSGGFVAPDAGGFIIVGVSGTDYAELAIDPAPPTVAAIQSGLSTLTTSDIDARLVNYDAATGSEATSILSAISALPSASAIAGAVWSNSTRTLTNFGTLISDIWSYVTRTITGGGITAGDVEAATISALTTYDAATGNDVSSLAYNVIANNPSAYETGKINAQYATTYSGTVTNIAIMPSDWIKTIFTVKKSTKDTDLAAVIKIVESNPPSGSDGLVILNQSATVVGTGELVVNYDAKTVTIIISDNTMVEVVPGKYKYDIKFINSSGRTVAIEHGDFIVRATVTHEV